MPDVFNWCGITSFARGKSTVPRYCPGVQNGRIRNVSANRPTRNGCHPYTGSVRKKNRHRARMIVLFGCMTALSAFAGVTGQPLGFIGVLFFGGGGAVYFYLDNPGRAGIARVRAHQGTLPGARSRLADPAEAAEAAAAAAGE